jgi:hypothetical protein
MLPQTAEGLRSLSRGRWIMALERIREYLHRQRGGPEGRDVRHLALRSEEDLQAAEQDPLLLLESLKAIRTLVYSVAWNAQGSLSFGLSSGYGGTVIVDANRCRVGPPNQWEPPRALFISDLRTALILQAVVDLTSPYALHVGRCEECNTLFYRRLGTRFCSQLCANKASVLRRRPGEQAVTTNKAATQQSSTDTSTELGVVRARSRTTQSPLPPERRGGGGKRQTSSAQGAVRRQAQKKRSVHRPTRPLREGEK